jgi:hypothetical protein
LGVRVELTLRVVATPDALHNDVVAPLCKPLSRKLGQGIPPSEKDLLATAVGRADENSGKVTRSPGCIVIRKEASAVFHDDRNIPLHLHPAARWRQTKEPRQQPTAR